MIDENYIDLVTGHLQNTLSTTERRRFNDLVEEGKIDMRDVKEMKRLYERVGSIGIPEPGSAMSDRFYAMLDAEKARRKQTVSTRILHLLEQFPLRHRFPRLAFAAGIFLIGLLAGDIYAPISNRDEQIDRLTTEVYKMREMVMINLLDDTSPTERLKAVNIGNEIRTVDERVITALLKTLNHDSNVNVRLAAVEALVSHASNPAARAGLIGSIANQESPIVQAALADAMLVLQEKQSIEEFKKLLEQNGLDSNVRSKLETTIAALS